MLGVKYCVGQNNKSQVLVTTEIRMPYRIDERYLVPLCCQMNISISVHLHTDSFPFACFIY